MLRHAGLCFAAATLCSLLTACAGGGYGFGGNNGSTQVDHIALTNGSGQANTFIVAPPAPLGGGVPPPNAIFVNRNGQPAPALPIVQVNAVGTSGPSNVVVPGAVFTWTAFLTTTDLATYSSGQNGVQKPCFPAASVTGGTVLPDVSPFSTTPVIWIQQNGVYQPLAPNQLSSTVYVSPAPLNLVTYAISRTNYCITLTAVGNGAQAQTQVAVTSTP
ncbi:MAG: hypothetical protein JO060_03980 [Candidatus Eremiobacteraeota bacterium]|nr:hypothetical protein [Candidatus Eremiobacteraeota bacterium]